jgi:hypothetical protein
LSILGGGNTCAQADQPAAALRQYREYQRLLAEAFGTSPTDEMTALFEAIRARRLPVTTPGNNQPNVAATLSLASPSQVSTPPYNLPYQTTSFVGRAQEIADIQRLLAATSVNA